jgi:hypothetical protein
LYTPAIELTSFDSLPLKSRVVILRRLLDALAQANIEYLQQNPNTPSLYEWGGGFTRYEIKKRPFSLDSWQDIPTTIAKGSGDCKDFCAWRVAELYLAYKGPFGFHIKTQVVPDAQRGDLIVYHIQVDGFQNGQFMREDPSKLLGMPTNLTPDQYQAVLSGG